MSSHPIWLAILVFGLSTVPQDRPVESLDREQLAAARAVVERLAKKLEKVKYERAEYEQRRTSLLLAKPLTSSGRIHIRRKPACIVFEVLEPRPIVIRSDSTSHQIYYPEGKRAERYIFESNELARALFACFTADIAEIEKTFSIASFEQRDGLSILGFRPRDKKVHATLTSLLLTVRDENAVVCGVTYVNSDAESVSLVLEKIELDPKNVKGPDIFDPKLPEGVRLSVQRVKPRGRSK